MHSMPAANRYLVLLPGILCVLILTAWMTEAASANLIPRGATWRYRDNGSDQGTVWRETDFNDNGWLSGRAQLGYGDGDEATVVSFGPDSNNRYITTYFRTRFVLTNAPQFTNLVIFLLRDDGAVVYLNGMEVARQNMPAGPVNFATRASISIPMADEVTYFSASLDPRLLVNGTNVMAVEVHQNGPQTSDMSFDLQCVGAFTTNAVPPTVVLTSPSAGEYFAASSNVLLRATASVSSSASARVQFFTGTNFIAEVLEPPYEFAWSNGPPGAHFLTARVIDSFGLAGQSSPVTAYVLAPDAPWPVLVPQGAVWKYLDTGQEPRGDWMWPTSDDGAWRSGRAQLGYGDGDEATVVGFGPDPNDKYISTYFRHTFVVTNAAYTNLYLRILRDDGALVRVNAVEVYRNNLPDGSIDRFTLARAAVGANDESVYHWRRVDPRLLFPGTNVVAVEIHQNAIDSTDLSFDLELTGNVPGPDTSFNLRPGQRGLIACVDHPDYNYDLYLPPGYSSNGVDLPLLYTFHANGGGMVGDFQSVAASRQFIVVGILESQNGVGWREYLDAVHAVTRDVRQRIHYDPTAAFAAGWSGGAVAAFELSKYLRPELAGVLSLSGWLEFRTNNVDRYLTNLLVARANGDSDAGANFYLTHDAPHLLRYGVTIRDWSFSGGHVVAPDSVKTECLNWFMTMRAPPGPMDVSDAEDKAAAWRAAISRGEREQVFRECVNSVMTRPRSYETRAALLVLDEIEEKFPTFQPINVAGAGSGDYALDVFYFRAFGAAKVGDVDRYYSALQSAAGIVDTGGDREMDFRLLLTTFGLPPPAIKRLSRFGPDQWSVEYAKGAPGVEYTCEEAGDLATGIWQSVDAVETSRSDGDWSIALPSSSASTRFMRLRGYLR